jgi:hypothetical protein
MTTVKLDNSPKPATTGGCAIPLVRRIMFKSDRYFSPSQATSAWLTMWILTNARLSDMLTSGSNVRREVHTCRREARDCSSP